ncbi:hypothetical protein [Hymenobacter daeguensis]
MTPALSFPYLNVHLHTTGAWPVLETEWLSFATSAEFRSSVEQALQLARQHRVKGWVADDRRLGAVRPRDLDWIHEELLLALSNMGLQRFAQLESHDALNRLTIATMYERALDGVAFEIRRFDDLELARAWAGGGHE